MAPVRIDNSKAGGNAFAKLYSHDSSSVLNATRISGNGAAVSRGTRGLTKVLRKLDIRVDS